MLPFLGRELLQLLRTRRRFLNLALLLLVGSAVATISWGVVVDQPGEVDTAFVGRVIFIGMAFVQLLVACGSGFWSARTVAGERERGSWDLLVATPVRPIRMLFEKMAGHVVMVLLFISSLVPILALCLLLGGVSPQDVFRVYAIVGAFVFVATVLGLACSAWCTREIVAMRTYTVLLFLYIAILPLILMVALDTFGKDPDTLVCISPLIAMIFLFNHEPLTIGGFGRLAGQPWTMFAMLSCIVVLVLLSITYLRLRRSWFEPLAARNSAREDQNQRAGRRSPFSDKRNLVMQRELMAMKRRLTGRWWMRMLLVGGLVGLLALIFQEPFTRWYRESWVILVYTIFFVGSLYATTATAGAIAGERRRETWSVLSTTLLQPHTILIGKFLAAVRRSGGIILLFSCALVAVAILMSQRTFAGIAGLSAGSMQSQSLWAVRPSLAAFSILMLGSWGMQMAAGLFFSVTSRTSVVAQVKTFAFACAHALAGILIIAIVALLAQFVFPSIQNLGPDRYLLRGLISLSPLTLMIDDGGNGLYSPWGGWAMFLHGLTLMTCVFFLLRFSAFQLQRRLAEDPGLTEVPSRKRRPRGGKA